MIWSTLVFGLVFWNWRILGFPHVYVDITAFSLFFSAAEPDLGVSLPPPPLRTRLPVIQEAMLVMALCLWTRRRSPAPASTTATSTTNAMTPAHTTVSTPCWPDPTAETPPRQRLAMIHSPTPRAVGGGRQDTCTVPRDGLDRSTLHQVRHLIRDSEGVAPWAMIQLYLWKSPKLGIIIDFFIPSQSTK